MLNYVWAGLILCSLIFALSTDISDLRHDAYGNGRPLQATIKSHEWRGNESAVDVAIAAADYREHFHLDEPLPEELPATLTRLEHGYRLRFADTAVLPPRLAAMRDFNDEKVLQANIGPIDFLPRTPDGGIDSRPMINLAPHDQVVSLMLPPVRFVKLRAITQAALDMSKNAVLTITFGLIGALALWLGLMKIAEASGLIEAMVKVIQPLLHPLFSEIPRGHPAMGYIAVNLAGNILGLGNATTAMGIKAMEELQTLNPTTDTATNSMVMLLALHTAAFQLVPPATLIAMMGFSAMELFIPMLLVGVIATAIGAIAAKLLGKLPMYRNSDPNRFSSSVVPNE